MNNVLGSISTNLIKLFDNIMEVQVCVPMRLKGELSCYNLNTKIQNIYNPKFNNGNEIEIFLEKKNDEAKKLSLIHISTFK